MSISCFDRAHAGTEQLYDFMKKRINSKDQERKVTRASASKSKKTPDKAEYKVAKKDAKAKDPDPPQIITTEATDG